jgi:hypothetical protein
VAAQKPMKASTSVLRHIQVGKRVNGIELIGWNGLRLT